MIERVIALFCAVNITNVRAPACNARRKKDFEIKVIFYLSFFLGPNVR
jgi:hypothetical protein